MIDKSIVRELFESKIFKLCFIVTLFLSAARVLFGKIIVELSYGIALQICITLIPTIMMAVIVIKICVPLCVSLNETVALHVISV
jgi:hypothetical protein